MLIKVGVVAAIFSLEGARVFDRPASF